MQIAAMTSQAALTASPRLSATMANATAPKRATAIHKSFVCGTLELLMALMGMSSCTAGTPPQNKSRPRPDFDQGKITSPQMLQIRSRAEQSSNDGAGG